MTIFPRFLLSTAVLAIFWTLQAILIPTTVSAQAAREKAYLHTDKPYYLLGDTIWFKAYVTLGNRNQLSAWSGALYVDLLNEKDSLIRSLKLPITAGTSMGDFPLNPTGNPGNYRIRAYTQWMRNTGEESFFERLISVGNKSGIYSSPSTTSTMQKAAVSTKLAQIDVQFFPEGGTLVNGISTRMAFKAVGMDGLGVDVKGIITDQSGKEVQRLETLRLGMGNFVFTPEAGKNYIAKYSISDGLEKTVALPQAKDEGYVLGVYQPNKDSILVRINVPEQSLLKTQQDYKELKLMVYAGMETLYEIAVNVNRRSSSIWLNKTELPSGILRFTLQDSKAEPLNERLLFLEKGEEMKLTLSTPEQSYAGRAQVLLELDARSSSGKASAGTYSVAVVNEDQVSIEAEEEHTIFSYLLLNSELKGYIEQANSYFLTNDETTDQALDNLMLSQGYRRFVWRTQSADSLVKPVFPVERLGNTISGQVLTLGNKPAAGAKVLLMAQKAGILQNTVADAYGRFKFEDLVLSDSINFTIQARSDKNSNKVEVRMDTLMMLASNKRMTHFSESTLGVQLEKISKSTDSLQGPPAKMGEAQQLKEVNISANKKEAAYATQGLFKIPEGHSDQTFVFKEADRCGSLLDCIQGRLHGVVFKPNGSVSNYPYSTRGPSMQVILDGNLLNNDTEVQELFDQATILPEDIVKIEVVRTNLALIGLLGKPSLMIYTRRGLPRKSSDPSMVHFVQRGYNKVREFYSPRYDRPGGMSQQSDNRSTIYWNANVKTYATGKTSLNFFNADGPGNYSVTVEGINADGELGRSVYRYKVTEGKATTTTPAFSKEVSKLLAASDSLRKKLPIEKVYLHTDKPYYNIGDTIWFKSYILDAAQLKASGQSGLLYVELYNDSAEVVRRISVPIKNGLAWAQIPLSPIVFPEGGYTLRAYTNWMQNFGSDYEFRKRFHLGLPGEKNWLVKSSPNISSTAQADQLNVELQLSKTDKTPVVLRDVEVLLYEGSKYLYKEKLQTNTEGKLNFSKVLKDKTDINNLRVVLGSLHEADEGQLLSIPLKIQRSQKIDLQFLPEGGHLVEGIQSQVAFKAIGEDGKPMNVNGRILNSKGAEVAVFNSLVNGMGSFSLNPQRNERYHAILIQPVETKERIELPLAAIEGTVMHIENPLQSDHLSLNISASANAISVDSTYFLVGMSRGVIQYAEKLIDPLARLEIPKMRFPTGITKFTLLRGQQPINERMVYIDHQDQFQISIKPEKDNYLKRDSVALEIEVKDKSGIPVKGNFSIAITDDTQVKADQQGNQSIRTSLLINSELKGKIENAGYYLNTTDSTVWKALDHLMLSQGWTGYSWNDLFHPVPTKYKAEKRQEIVGKVTNLLNKPVSGSQVLISSQKPSFINTVFTGKDGYFNFRDLPQIDSGSFFIQAKTASGKTKSFGAVELEHMRFPEVPETFRDKVFPWYVNNDSTLLNYVSLKAAKAREESLKQSGIALREVKITTKKIIKNSMNRNGPGKADLIFDEKDIKESTVLNLYQLLKQKLPGIKVVYERGVPTLKYNKYLVVVEIDGGGLPIVLDVPYTKENLIEELSQFQIATFKGMEVMYSRDFMRNYALNPPMEAFTGEQISKSEIAFSTGSGFIHPEGLPGVGIVDLDGPFYKSGYRGGYLEARVNILTNVAPEIAVVGITTGNQRGWYRNESPDFATYRPVPLMKAEQFYSPKYTAKPEEVAEPDYRSTIYWEPNLVTDANGRAKVFFYTSDVKGKYTISVEGVDFKGGMGSLRYSHPF